MNKIRNYPEEVSNSSLSENFIGETLEERLKEGKRMLRNMEKDKIAIIRNNNRTRHDMRIQEDEIKKDIWNTKL